MGEATYSNDFEAYANGQSVAAPGFDEFGLRFGAPSPAIGPSNAVATDARAHSGTKSMIGQAGIGTDYAVTEFPVATWQELYDLFIAKGVIDSADYPDAAALEAAIGGMVGSEDFPTEQDLFNYYVAVFAPDLLPKLAIYEISAWYYFDLAPAAPPSLGFYYPMMGGSFLLSFPPPGNGGGALNFMPDPDAGPPSTPPTPPAPGEPEPPPPPPDPLAPVRFTFPYGEWFQIVAGVTPDLKLQYMTVNGVSLAVPDASIQFAYSHYGLAVSGGDTGDGSALYVDDVQVIHETLGDTIGFGSLTLEAPAVGIGRRVNKAPALKSSSLSPRIVFDKFGVSVTKRWRFRDLETQETWTLPINPDSMSNPLPSRNFEHAPYVRRQHAAGTIVTPTLKSWQFGGVIRTKQQHDKLLSWGRRTGRIAVTDHLGRTFICMFSDLTITERQPTARNQWRLRYSIEARIIKF